MMCLTIVINNELNQWSVQMSDSNEHISKESQAPISQTVYRILMVMSPHQRCTWQMEWKYHQTLGRYFIIYRQVY